MTDAEELFHLYDRAAKAAFERFYKAFRPRRYWVAAGNDSRQLWREIAEAVMLETVTFYKDKDTAAEKRATGRLE